MTVDSTKLNDWMQVIGIFAVVASLIFVGLQLRQDQAIAVSESYSSATDSVGDLATLVKSNSKIWRTGLDGSKLPAEDELVFKAMAIVVEQYVANRTQRLVRIGGGEGDAGRSVENYAYALYVHPGLRAAYAERLAYGDSVAEAFGDPRRRPFYRVLEEKLKQLDAASPDILETKTYVFW
jgi:hypothetical protein